MKIGVPAFYIFLLQAKKIGRAFLVALPTPTPFLA
jgi:hypothetical protein